MKDNRVQLLVDVGFTNMALVYFFQNISFFQIPVSSGRRDFLLLCGHTKICINSELKDKVLAPEKPGSKNITIQSRTAMLKKSAVNSSGHPLFNEDMSTEEPI